MDTTKFKGSDWKMSKLGFGCMRFPTNNEGLVDFGKTSELIGYAIENGVNYFDSGYFYQGGQSEKAMGHALKAFNRASYTITDKLPNFACASEDQILATFEEQLKRCQTDYFDFYFMHNVNERSLAQFTKPHVIKALEKLKKEGRVRGLGFSSHAGVETLEWLSGFYDWDLAQIQLNRLDWEGLDSKGQYEILNKRGIQAVIMEPLRGGRLSSITPEADMLLKRLDPNKSVASYLFRFAGTLPGVAVVLSGMNDLGHVKENIGTFSNMEPLSEEELKTLDEALEMLISQGQAMCTKCRYCVDGCPQSLDIPALIERYNSYLVSRHFMEMLRLSWLPEDRQPKACVACGQCAEKCPQNIDVPSIMEKLTGFMAEQRAR